MKNIKEKVNETSILRVWEKENVGEGIFKGRIFEAILELVMPKNARNQEVQQILSNIRKNKSKPRYMSMKLWNTKGKEIQMQPEQKVRWTTKEWNLKQNQTQ